MRSLSSIGDLIIFRPEKYRGQNDLIDQFWPHFVSGGDLVRKLVKLLIKQEAWTQKTPEAVALPDEGRATLKIVAGDAESTIWERVREMEKNDRLIRISALLQKLAWREAPPK